MGKNGTTQILVKEYRFAEERKLLFLKSFKKNGEIFTTQGNFEA